MEKTYIFMDIQDPSEQWEGSLKEGKEFLVFNWNEEDFNNDEEYLKWEENVHSLEFEEFKDKLLGIDWTVFDSEEEMIAWKNEVEIEV